MSKFVNYVRSNPKTSAAGVVLLIILVVLIVWIVNRSGNDNDKNEEVDGRPEIEIIDMSKSIKPIDEVEVTETYENYTILELAKQVDFTLRWNNKGGVETINKLIFIRKNADGVEVQKKEITKGIEGTEQYFKPFSKNNSFTFAGDLASDVNLLGKNQLYILYVLNDSTTETKIFDSNDTFTGDNAIQISQEDLKIAEYSDEVQSVTYTPTVGTFSISKITSKDVYYLYPGGSEFDSFDIYSSIIGTSGDITFVPAGTTDGNNFYIYLTDVKKYIGSQTDTSYTDAVIAVTNVTDAKALRLTNTPGVSNRYRIQDVVSGKFLGMKGGKAVFINISDERVTEKLYATIDLEILETAKDGECLYTETWSPCGPDDDYTRATINITRNTAKCASISKSAPKLCTKDAVCVFNWDQCPVSCGGTDTMQEVAYPIIQSKPAVAGGKSCVDQKPAPRACGRQPCKVGRACFAKPGGNKIVRDSDCKAIHGNSCWFDSYDTECVGYPSAYQKTCPSGVEVGNPGCEKQQEFWGNVDGDNHYFNYEELLGTIPVVE